MYLNPVPNDPFEFLWPLHIFGRYGEKLGLSIVHDPDEPVEGCIHLRQGGADYGYQRDYYIDPNRDYICVKHVEVYFEKGKLVSKQAESLEGFYQLPGGQWCAARRIEGDPSKSTMTWTVGVKVLAENELPADIFNGQKLLEGADVTLIN